MSTTTKRPQITASDITGPALGGVPKKVIDFAWKYARILGVSVLPRIAIRNNISSTWLGRCHFKLGQENLMEIQKRVMYDDRTLERIVAHEMAHHADYLELTENEIALLRARIKRTSHGPRWQAFANKINRVMGDDFVTVFSDASHITAPETKPFVLMIAKMHNGRLAYAFGVRFTERMRASVYRQGASMEVRLIESRDPRWTKGPRIGLGKLAIPIKPSDYQDLQDLFAKGVPVKGQ
jgi:hypothetical protein